MTLQDDIMQSVWQTFAVETGRALPEGLANKLAAAAMGCMKPETRTLTNGWVQPMHAAFARLQAQQWAAMTGQPYVDPPVPEIREQQRWVTEWEDIT